MTGKDNCKVCLERVGKMGILCDRCEVWHHAKCQSIDGKAYESLANSRALWFCSSCLLLAGAEFFLGAKEVNVLQEEIVSLKIHLAEVEARKGVLPSGAGVCELEDKSIQTDCHPALVNEWPLLKKSSVRSIPKAVSHRSEQNGAWSRVVGGARPKLVKDGGARVSEGGWCKVVGGAKPKSAKERLGPKVSNRFSCLDKVSGSSGPNQDSNLVVLGDSQVRNLGSKLAMLGKKSRVQCYPGARVADINRRVSGGASISLDEVPDVVVHVGGNDIMHVKSEEQIASYRSLLGTLKDKCRNVFVTSILPRRHKGGRGEWLSRALGLNSRIESICQELDFRFVDCWDIFYNRQDLYARDGIHFSDRGVDVLGRSILNALSQGN